MVATLLKTALATGACAAAGSLATEPDGAWYRSLKSPGWKPPDWVIPVVWTGLYANIAVTSALTLDELARGHGTQAHRYKCALGLNLTLNAGWSWVFFKAQRLAPATVGAAVLTISSTNLVRRTAQAGRAKGIALAPYALWCGFATALTAALLRRNPDSR